MIFAGLAIKRWTFFAMYFFRLCGSFALGFILDKVLKMHKNNSFFIAEIPDYKIPLLRNVCLTVYEKTKGFVVGAGKFILAISILLWFLGSHGIGEKYNSIEHRRAVGTNSPVDCRAENTLHRSPKVLNTRFWVT